MLGVLYGYKALLQVIALVFSFSIRKVKVKGLDDSIFIAASIYVSSIVLAVIIVSTYTLKDLLNVFPVVFCTGFLIGTTVILGLVFVPLVSAQGLYCRCCLDRLVRKLVCGDFTNYNVAAGVCDLLRFFLAFLMYMH